MANARARIVDRAVAGDSVGINPYVARLRADGLEVTTFSGVIGGA